MPVLVGVNNLNYSAFESFAAGTAVELPNSAGEAPNWISLSHKIMPGVRESHVVRKGAFLAQIDLN